MGSESIPQSNQGDTGSKRKRVDSINSPSPTRASPPTRQQASQDPPRAKSNWTQDTLQINYLVRQYDEDLPLITSNDSLPDALTFLNRYYDIIDREESLAGNLGARPLGPMLFKRFERLFDGPPRIIQSQGTNSNPGGRPQVTWLDVLDFARSKPEQFILQQMSEDVKVCQFYMKQCQVEISEEDFFLVNSGIPQKMIPPQPITEDEEKELGTLEILENNVAQISHFADQGECAVKTDSSFANACELVAARARQFNHRVRIRKQAIIERRTAEFALSGVPSLRAASPSNVALMSGVVAPSTQSPGTGLNAVNIHQAEQIGDQGTSQSSMISHPAHASEATRTELLRNFFTTADRRTGNSNIDHNGVASLRARSERPSSYQRPSPSYRNTAIASLPPPGPSAEFASTMDLSYSAYSTGTPPITVAIPNTPVALMPRSRPFPVDSTDDGGPYKAEMVARLEGLARGDQILPACDRCKRLRMDCLKNLTACMGCTKKHAKCSWKEVREDDIKATADWVGRRHEALVAAAQEARERERGFSGANYYAQNQGQQQQRRYEGMEGMEELANHAHQQAAHSLAVAAMDQNVGDVRVGVPVANMGYNGGTSPESGHPPPPQAPMQHRSSIGDGESTSFLQETRPADTYQGAGMYSHVGVHGSVKSEDERASHTPRAPPVTEVGQRMEVGAMVG